MSIDDKRGPEMSPSVVYSPLDRGDFVPASTTRSPLTDTTIEKKCSEESALNIITIYDSNPSDETSSERVNYPGIHQESKTCCVCYAAWSHWKGEVNKRGKTNHTSADIMDKSCILRNNAESVCRICLEERGEEEFISPCDCAGTMGMVHRSCLERWLSLLNSSECEICRHKFRVHRYLRPARQFQFQQLPLDVCGDIICIAILSPLCILIIYFTIDMSLENIRNGRQAGAIALIIVASSVVILYFVWVFCTLKHAIGFWWGCNRVVRLSNNQVAPRRATANSQ